MDQSSFNEQIHPNSPQVHQSSRLPLYIRYEFSKGSSVSVVSQLSGDLSSEVLILRDSDCQNIHLPLSSNGSQSAWCTLLANANAIVAHGELIHIQFGALPDVLIDTLIMSDGTEVPVPLRVWVVLSKEGGRNASGFMILNKPSGQSLIRKHIAYIEDITGYDLAPEGAEESRWLDLIPYTRCGDPKNEKKSRSDYTSR